MKEGSIKETGKLSIENPYCGAFPDFIAIPLQVDNAKGCNPHCLVNIETHETEINWMCTGLVDESDQPKETDGELIKDVDFFDTQVSILPGWKVTEKKEPLPGGGMNIINYTLYPDLVNKNDNDVIIINDKRQNSSSYPGDNFLHHVLLSFHFQSGLLRPIQMYTNSSNSSVLREFNDIKRQVGVAAND